MESGCTHRNLQAAELPLLGILFSTSIVSGCQIKKILLQYRWHEENKRRHMRKENTDAHPEQDH
jgi:hypothetical protein